jgi:hypothetical protein
MSTERSSNRGTTWIICTAAVTGVLLATPAANAANLAAQHRTEARWSSHSAADQRRAAEAAQKKKQQERERLASEKRDAQNAAENW